MTTRFSRPSVALAVIVVVVGGIWIAGLLSPNVYVHGAVSALWSVVVALGIWRATRQAPDIRVAAWGALAMTLVVVLAVGAVVSRPKQVDEKVVTAGSASVAATNDGGSGQDSDDTTGNVLVASGSFESLAHEGKGTASVIELEDGSRKLTLTNFKTDAGPDLFVYVVAGDPQSDGDVTEFLNLGGLKGNSGDQQYDLPKSFEASKYRHVYIWCRAFTVGFTRAELAT